MTRGRRPTPTHLRLLTGNPQRRPLPKDEPGVPSAPALMPPWLRAADAYSSGITSASLKELRGRAAELAIAGRSKMEAPELVEAILDADPGPRERAWQEMAAPLEAMRVLTAIDVHALAMAVVQYVRVIELELYIAQVGPTYETEGRYGLQIKRRPEVSQAAEAWNMTMRALIEFGMTPASRTKVSIAPASGAGGLADLMTGEGAS